MYKPFIVILAACLIAASVQDGSLQQYWNEITYHLNRTP